MMNLDRLAEEQLLGRPSEDVLTSADRSAFRGQRLLVTGAGGSLGAELARQLARCAPQSLTVFDHSEYQLFQIERNLREEYPNLDLTAILGDVSRRADIRAACLSARPSVVYHAAAYKHVPIAEHSIIAAARVNVLGTVEAVRAAHEVGARFVLVSSDKAAEPRSVMGGTKRLAELLTLGQRSRRFRPIAVRFGNILGSSGSVVEIMLRAARSGRNVPVTAPDATRFFMTATEAVSLVLKADLSGRGGEVFWLDMGPPLRIGELAERVIAYVAGTGAPRVGIDVIGLRAGEKMREELTAQGLQMRRTKHARIWSARQRDVSRRELDQCLRQIRRGCASGDAAGVLAAIAAAVGDFHPSATAIAAARRASLIAAAPTEAARTVANALVAAR